MKSQHSKNRPSNLTYSKVYDFALEHVFKYDRDKCNVWWMTKHDVFDNQSPYELVKAGRGEWLMRNLTRTVL